MDRAQRRASLNYGIALVAVAATMLLRHLLNPVLGTAAPLILFIIPVVVSAWFGGFGPGMLATVIAGTVGLAVFGAPQPHAIEGTPLQVWLIRETPFFFVCTVISLFATRIARANARADAQAVDARSAAADARRSEAFVRRVMSSSPDSIHVLDLEGRLLHLSESALRSLGIDSSSKFLGRPWLDLWRKGDHAIAADALKESLSGRTGSFRAARESDGGDVRWWDVLVTAVQGDDGRPTQVLSVARDITHARAVEMELAASQKKVADEQARMLIIERDARRVAEDALQIAETASRAKDEFLAIVSHELRTPLSSIVGWADLLQNPSARESQLDEGLAVIRRGAAAQSKIIDDILDVSRITSGKVRLNMNPLKMYEPIEAAIRTVKPSADGKGIALKLDVQDDVEIVGDIDRLQQVFWNVLANAIKFTDRGGTISVRAWRDRSRAIVTVTDTGKGIDAEFLPHVFERFRQADMSTTRRTGGLGLGLAIVRHLVELHGGTVAVQSEGVGHGSTFRVEIPVGAVISHSSSTLPDPAKQTQPAAATLSGKRLLALDDDPDARRLVEAVLLRAQAQVTTVGSVAEAIGLLESPQHGFDLVISDLGMPDVDGYEFIRRLRSLEKTRGTRRLPAAALSAYTRPVDRAATLAAGFDEHLGKPVQPAELSAAIARLIDR